MALSYKKYTVSNIAPGTLTDVFTSPYTRTFVNKNYYIFFGNWYAEDGNFSYGGHRSKQK